MRAGGGNGDGGGLRYYCVAAGKTKEEAEKGNASADGHGRVQGLSWHSVAQRGMTERADGDARPPRGAETLNRSVTVARHQSLDSSLIARIGDLQSPNP